jgi:hypothetical protein
MRSKLFIISIMAIVGIMGCSKEEEITAIPSGIEQTQPDAATAEAVIAPVASSSAPATAEASNTTSLEAVPVVSTETSAASSDQTITQQTTQPDSTVKDQMEIVDSNQESTPTPTSSVVDQASQQNAVMSQVPEVKQIEETIPSVTESTEHIPAVVTK